jgi:hypothetical protein
MNLFNETLDTDWAAIEAELEQLRPPSATLKQTPRRRATFPENLPTLALNVGEWVRLVLFAISCSILCPFGHYMSASHPLKKLFKFPGPLLKLPVHHFRL